MNSVLAFLLTSSPMAAPHNKFAQNRHAAAQHSYGASHQRPPLRASLSVCTEEDCLQQGAPQTLVKLRKAAKGKGVKVASCPCLGMCGLGPCVSIEWGASRMESRGGVDPQDDAAIRRLIQEAINPPSTSPPPSQERDPYAEQ